MIYEADDEPTGLGAVVEDSKGQKWLRVGEPGDLFHPWAPVGSVSASFYWAKYPQIDVVRVLSEGMVES